MKIDNNFCHIEGKNMHSFKSEDIIYMNQLEDKTVSTLIFETKSLSNTVFREIYVQSVNKLDLFDQLVNKYY